VRVTFFASAGGNHVLESAPTLDGPWLPLNVPITEAELPGTKQATVPTSLTAQFFRLVQVP
jgi:hypothetical protein